MDRNKINKLLMEIEKHKSEIIDLLTEYESFSAAEHELWLAIDCLKNIEIESEYLSQKSVKNISVFLPLNLPLYSYIIFCIIPSFSASNTYYRSPKLLEGLFSQMREILNIDSLFESVQPSTLSRNSFVEVIAASSDVIIFTGSYENALSIKRKCPNSLFIFNGAAVDPIVVFENADIDLAVEKTIEARLFNSGQDCAGPDAILISEKIEKEFSSHLVNELKKVKIGSYTDTEVLVGKLISKDSISIVQQIFEQEKNAIIFGGTIDSKKQIIHPTIISKKLSLGGNYQEFFSPIFFVASFSSIKDLNDYFFNTLYSDYAMYASVFGSCDTKFDVPNSVVLKNKTLIDIERGNFAYGGYGYKANFVSYKSKVAARPILISKEIFNWSKNKMLVV